MWKQYGKDVETICEGCGNNMNWKQYDQNFHEPRLVDIFSYISFFKKLNCRNFSN